MCAIFGIVSKKNSHEIKFYLEILTKILHHRGPDGSGIFIENNVGIGHNRLAIRDETSNGSQPMFSNCGMYLISYNGEIYNSTELNSEYLIPKGIILKGNSDTEVLLEMLVNYGIDFTLQKINGMFSFSFYDRKLHKLILARDFFGEKPLYYYNDTNNFIFSSEVKGIKSIVKNLEINENSINEFLDLGYFKSTPTIYKDIHEVQPNSYIEIDILKNDFTIKYINNKIKKINNITAYIESDITSRFIADTKIGIFLSGGIDSNLVRFLSKGAISYTAVFDDYIYNESDPNQDRLPNRRFVKCTNDDLYHQFTQLPFIYDYPCGDPSILPLLLLSKEAKNDVKVCLTGDAADEIYGGYNKYLYSYYRSVKIFILILKFLNTKFINKYLPIRDFKYKLIKLKSFNYDFREMMADDIKNYLPKNCLKKTDIATMAYSIEGRSAYTNKDLYLNTLLLPNNKFISNYKGKILLRQLLSKFSSKKFLFKKGFDLPISDFLKFNKDKFLNILKYDDISDKFFNKYDIIHQIGNDNYRNINYIYRVLVLKQFFNHENNNNI